MVSCRIRQSRRVAKCSISYNRRPLRICTISLVKAFDAYLILLTGDMPEKVQRKQRQIDIIEVATCKQLETIIERRCQFLSTPRSEI